MLKLPDVSLVMIETMEHELARLAVNDCVQKANFGEVLICTDKPELFQPLDCRARFHVVENWPAKIGWSRFSWFGIPPLMNTGHALCIQWDSWIVDPTAWQDRFLDYDYIGASWDWHSTRKVGNGGFALRSTRMMKFVRDNRDVFPCTTAADDDLLCRVYRAKLEECGFLWAPLAVARDFAFECTPPEDGKKYFGFHAAMNFGLVLKDHDRLLERARLMHKSPYLGANPRGSYIWNGFADRNPAIVAQVKTQADAIAEVFGGEGDSGAHRDPGVLPKKSRRKRAA